MLFLLFLVASASAVASADVPCANEVCVFRSLKDSGIDLPKGKAEPAIKAAALPYLQCLNENLETVTWVWPQGNDVEQARWVVGTTWDVCSKERTVATMAIVEVLHTAGSYPTVDDERKAADRYRSGRAYALYLLRFMKIGKFEAFKGI